MAGIGGANLKPLDLNCPDSSGCVSEDRTDQSGFDGKTGFAEGGLAG